MGGLGELPNMLITFVINVENSSTSRDIFVRIIWWIESLKEQHLFAVEIFSNIINVFLVTFDKFNASLLNKSIKILLPPDFWMVYTYMLKQ